MAAILMDKVDTEIMEMGLEMVMEEKNTNTTVAIMTEMRTEGVATGMKGAGNWLLI